jgi:hypothetical protein
MSTKQTKPKKKILPKPEKAISVKQSIKIINDRYGEALANLAK